jgi:hypothetical protein
MTAIKDMAQWMTTNTTDYTYILGQYAPNKHIHSFRMHGLKIGTLERTQQQMETNEEKEKRSPWRFHRQQWWPAFQDLRV